MNKEVGEAFRVTTKLILGKELSPIDDYGPWLRKNLGEEEVVDSALSGDRMHMIKQYNYLKLIPKKRIISFRDGLGEAAEMKIGGIGRGSSLNDVLGGIPGIAYFDVNEKGGENKNNEETLGLVNAVNTYKTNDAFQSKNIAFGYYNIRSESVFGSFKTLYTKYAINCYNAAHITNCFECDSVKHSSRVYFSHNCENVHDAMFCSNAKNLRYAVGNVVVGRDKYMEVKKILLDYVLGELEAKKSLELDIFNIGAL